MLVLPKADVSKAEGTEIMIRVSCAALSRIQYRDKRFLVILNKNRLQSGRQILTPIGGSLWYYDLSTLLSLGVCFERENSKDLRLYIEESRLPEFAVWFEKREGREIDPFRELYEELVLEERLVRTLIKQNVNIQFAGPVTDRRYSTKDANDGRLTNYFFEVFYVTLSDLLWDEVLGSMYNPACRETSQRPGDTDR